MPKVEHTIDIRAPIDRVFPALTDPRRSSEWNPNIIDVSQISSNPIGEGTTWRQVMSIAGRPANLLCRVVQFRPPYEGILQITGDQRGQTCTRCMAIDGGTRVTQSLEFTLPGGLLGKAMEGMVRSQLQRELERTMERQRVALEREAGTS